MMSTGSDLLSSISTSNLSYISGNFFLVISEPGINGTPLNVAYAGSWNGSLWTLHWEFLCYLGVLAVGLSGLLRFRATVPILFSLALLAACITVLGQVDTNDYVNGARLGLMFMAGALIERYKKTLPLN